MTAHGSVGNGKLGGGALASFSGVVSLEALEPPHAAVSPAASEAITAMTVRRIRSPDNFSAVARAA
jgi:hypothetical protein